MTQKPDTQPAAQRERDRKHMTEYVQAYIDRKWTMRELMDVLVDMLDIEAREAHSEGAAEARRAAAGAIHELVNAINQADIHDNMKCSVCGRTDAMYILPEEHSPDWPCGKAWALAAELDRMGAADAATEARTIPKVGTDA